MKLIKSILLITFSLVGLIGCKTNYASRSPLPFYAEEMLYDEGASELLVKTPAGVMRYGAEGKLIQGPRENLIERFETLKKTSVSKAPASVVDLAQTPLGLISYQAQSKSLFISHPNSYPRLILANIEQPKNIVYSRATGRLFLTLESEKALLSLILRPSF